ncbi:hypothetical protein AVEN_275770-1 [Araneus ventricosus]|uniref:Uncharacterized protein n=1 Tax=Araneus ventricosus TaxID=182803 RepID=A0A4Y2HEL1_ARAVE|nr:hypothetical protein AVEN_275770-1 [Araneus ventricosus]
MALAPIDQNGLLTLNPLHVRVESFEGFVSLDHSCAGEHKTDKENLALGVVTLAYVQKMIAKRICNLKERAVPAPSSGRTYEPEKSFAIFFLLSLLVSTFKSLRPDHCGEMSAVSEVEGE